MLHYSHTLIMPCITCSSPIIFIFSLSFNTLQNALMQQHSSFSSSNKPLHKGGHLVLTIASLVKYLCCKIEYKSLHDFLVLDSRF